MPVLAYGFAVISEAHHRVGRVWRVREHDNEKPSLDDVRALLQEAVEELNAEPHVIESYIRIAGPIRTESHSLVRALTLPVPEFLLHTWDSQRIFYPAEQPD